MERMDKDKDNLKLLLFVVAIVALFSAAALAQFEIGGEATPVAQTNQGVQVDIDNLETPALEDTGNLANARYRVVLAIHLLAAKPGNRENLQIGAVEFFEGAISDPTVQAAIGQAIQGGVLTQAQSGVVKGALRGTPEKINNGTGARPAVDELIRALRFATWEEAFGIPDADLGGEPTNATRTALIQTLVAYADAVIQTAAATLPSQSLTVDMGFEE